MKTLRNTSFYLLSLALLLTVAACDSGGSDEGSDSVLNGNWEELNTPEPGTSELLSIDFPDATFHYGELDPATLSCYDEFFEEEAEIESLGGGQYAFTFPEGTASAVLQDGELTIGDFEYGQTGDSYSEFFTPRCN